jgi:hypothetical protein
MLMRRNKQGWAVVTLHYSADPEFSGERLRREAQKYTGGMEGSWWQKEMEIKYDALSGARIFPEFDPKIHVLPADKIPVRGCRYMAIDPHPRTPHAMLWVLIDQWSDWYVYREMWPSAVYGESRSLDDGDREDHYTVREYADTIAQVEGNEIEWRNEHKEDMYGIYRRLRRGSTRYLDGKVVEAPGEYIVDRFMDQAGKAFRASGENQEAVSYAERYNAFGIECRDPDKRHKPGFDAIHDMLKPRRHEVYGNWPRLHVADTCHELILEFLKYRYKLTKRFDEDRELKQEGVEARCHLLDALRYLATGDIGYYRSMES